MSLNRRASAVIVIPLIGGTAIIVTLWNDPWTVSKIVGLVLLVPGFLLVTIARLNLGNAFSVKPQATSLVTTGLYSRIRNPIYVFSTIAIAGLILYMNRPLFVPIVLPLIALQVWRARQESRVLEAKFGEEYVRFETRFWHFPTGTRSS